MKHMKRVGLAAMQPCMINGYGPSQNLGYTGLVLA